MPTKRAAGVRRQPAFDEQMNRMIGWTYKQRVSSALAEHFFERGAASPEREAQLEQLTEIARADWPELPVTDAQWASHLRRHCRGRDLDEWLASVWPSDLYVAAGCALGLPSAHEAFDRSFLSQVPSFVAQFSGQESFADEVRQALRLRLLAATPGAEPKIAEYGGLGALVSFVRVASVRVAINLRRGAQETRTSTEEAVLEALPVESDPALALIRAKYGPVFKEAMRDAFRALPQEQREALRLQFAGRYPGHRIATVMGVHRATVTRWLTAARVGVLGGTRRLLQERLRLQDSEIDSLIAVLRSQLDTSLSDLVSS